MINSVGVNGIILQLDQLVKCLIYMNELLSDVVLCLVEREYKDLTLIRDLDALLNYVAPTSSLKMGNPNRWTIQLIITSVEKPDVKYIY